MAMTAHDVVIQNPPVSPDCDVSTIRAATAYSDRAAAAIQCATAHLVIIPPTLAICSS